MSNHTIESAGPQAGKATPPQRLAPRTRLAIQVHVRLATCRNLLMRECRRSVERWSLTLPQFDVLAELARAPEAGFTFVELSRKLLVTSGNLTGIVDRLEAERLVRREPHPSDRRVTHIRLTEKGRKLTQQMLPAHAEDVADLLALVPRGRLEALAELLAELRAKLHERVDRGDGPAPAPRRGGRVGDPAAHPPLRVDKRLKPDR